MPKFAAKDLIKFPNALYFVSIFLILLLVAVYLIYEFHRQLTISAKQQYIGLISANLISTDQSIDELLNTLNVGQSSYNKILGSKDASGTFNYNIIVGNNQKSLNQIELLKDNLNFQKNLQENAKTPGEYRGLENGFNNYYTESTEFLEKLEQNYEYENGLLKNLSQISVGSDISQKDLWQTNDKELILNYFTNLKSGIASSLEKLSRFKTPQKYEEYYNLHLSYLQLLTSAAEEIVSLLEEEELIQDSESPGSIEVAYKVATEAQNEINLLMPKLVEERERIFKLKETLADVEKLANIQQNLEGEIKNLYQLLYAQSSSKYSFGF